jgi:hypothetical protein
MMDFICKNTNKTINMVTLYTKLCQTIFKGTSLVVSILNDVNDIDYNNLLSTIITEFASAPKPLIILPRNVAAVDALIDHVLAIRYSYDFKWTIFRGSGYILLVTNHVMTDGASMANLCQRLPSHNVPDNIKCDTGGLCVSQLSLDKVKQKASTFHVSVSAIMCAIAIEATNDRLNNVLFLTKLDVDEINAFHVHQLPNCTNPYIIHKSLNKWKRKAKRENRRLVKLISVMPVKLAYWLVKKNMQ